MHIKHFESYRWSLAKVSLEGAEIYAKTVATKRPDEYPTIYDYLKHILTKTKDALFEADQDLYYDYLKKHQFGMIQLFEKMVEERLWGYEHAVYDDYSKMINQWGYNWFKFSKLYDEGKKVSGLECNLKDFDRKEVILIPRYLSEQPEKQEHVILDSDELRGLNLLKEVKNFDELLICILKMKIKEPNLKVHIPEDFKIEGIVEPASVLCKLDDLNDWLRVREWTLPLG